MTDIPIADIIRSAMRDLWDRENYIKDAIRKEITTLFTQLWLVKENTGNSITSDKMFPGKITLGIDIGQQGPYPVITGDKILDCISQAFEKGHRQWMEKRLLKEMT